MFAFRQSGLFLEWNTATDEPSRYLSFLQEYWENGVACNPSDE